MVTKFILNPLTGKFDLTLDIQSPMDFKGTITVAADFPTLANVESGWFYLVDTDVTDNDATKTNTGQSFSAGDEIIWNGVAWTIAGNELIYVPYTGSTAAVALGTYDFSVNNTDFYVDVANSKVGIGTDSPYKKMDINYNSDETDIGANVGTAVSGLGLGVVNENTTADSYSFIDIRAGSADSRIATIHKSTNTGQLAFLTDKSGLHEAMRIDEDGNVGIGTTSPNAKLEIIGDVIIDLTD